METTEVDKIAKGVAAVLTLTQHGLKIWIMILIIGLLSRPIVIQHNNFDKCEETTEKAK